ncbi:hypothetical protein B0H21DRAFT_761594 [Amylocystis lapponica]|nr:hypothetical protein B0H21DRAFT_761594 [Amylocystis lapponica]
MFALCTLRAPSSVWPVLVCRHSSSTVDEQRAAVRVGIMTRNGRILDVVSDAIDEVNMIKFGPETVWNALRSYYEGLIERFFPGTIEW